MLLGDIFCWEVSVEWNQKELILYFEKIACVWNMLLFILLSFCLKITLSIWLAYVCKIYQSWPYCSRVKEVNVVAISFEIIPLGTYTVIPTSLLHSQKHGECSFFFFLNLRFHLDFICGIEPFPLPLFQILGDKAMSGRGDRRGGRTDEFCGCVMTTVFIYVKNCVVLREVGSWRAVSMQHTTTAAPQFLFHLSSSIKSLINSW